MTTLPEALRLAKEDRLVQVDSLDCESLTLAIAVLAITREQVTDSEFHARLAIAESVLTRIVKDSMMKSPVALEFLKEQKP